MNQISKINLGGVDYDIRDNSKLTPIAYADLVSLRDNGSLVAGAYYRITDYVTTTTQENTQSAGHPFDVIVLALSENTLAEEAYAIQSARDTDGYFANSNLSAWKLWYSLDNDTKRFAWAIDFAFLRYEQVFTWNGNANDSSGSLMYEWEASDGTIVYTKTLTPQVGESTYDDLGDEDGIVENIINGKGVIYRMIDEWNNDIPYDFKNIQFKRFAVTEYEKSPALVVDNEENYYGYYYGALTLYGEQAIREATYGEDFVWVYTFALKDLATDTWHDYSVLNAIGLRTDESVVITCHSNVIKEHRDEYLGDYGRKAAWLNNIVFLNCYTDITSPDYADEYSYCNSNSFVDGCNSNSFGNGCYSNSFGNDCNSNSFGNGCYSNSFGNGCGYNSFGNGCYSNSFVDGCGYNSFGNGCYSNSFGNDCYYNSFGNGCYSNSFVDEDGLMNQLEKSRIDDGVNNVRFFFDGDSNAVRIKNNHFCRGIEDRIVEIMVTDNEYEEIYSMTSDGELRYYCIADVV